MKNTQIYPIVTIEPDYIANYNNGYDEVIHLSTNSVSLDHITSKNYILPILENVHFKPLLLNIPSIKQSVDIESRKFKTSRVSLNISNFEYQGERFSDILSETSLINRKVSIQFVSPSKNMFSTIFRSSVITNGISFYDYYKNDEEHAPLMAEMVYQGVIRRISHDDEQVKIEVEDLTEQKIHKDLPLANLGDEPEIADKDKNKPIPMVFGKVDRSPAYVTNYVVDLGENEPFSSDLVVSDKEIKSINETAISLGNTTENDSGIFVYEDDTYVPLNQSAKESVDLEGFVTITSSINEGTTAPIKRRFTNISAITGEVYWDSPNDYDWIDWLFGQEEGELLSSDQASIAEFIFNYHVGDATGAPAIGDSYEQSDFTDPAFNRNLALQYIASTNSAKGITIHGLTSGHSNGQKGGYHCVELELESMGSDFDCDSYVISNVARRFNDFNGQGLLGSWDGVTGNGRFIFFGGQVPTSADNASNLTNLTGGTIYDNPVRNFSQLNDYPSLRVGNVGIEGQSNNYLKAHWDEIRYLEMFQVAYIPTLISRNFYVNINGRVNTFNDHPEDLDDGDFIQNPINIVYEILRNDLELESNKIDYNSYVEATNNHSDWHFGFTVNKEINSKKLIGEILKSTKCFPHFKSDGTFAFNTIKDLYTVSGDYATATEIKQEDIINYSFKKSKPEQIYRKVDVQYKWDYGQGSYLKRTPVVDRGSDDYYGIEDSSNSYLAVESKYIREEETAIKLRNFISMYYKNDHLMFNVKLPLSYSQLDIGSLVKFRSLINNIKAYGIDYRKIQNPNGQWYYPLFKVFSIKRSLDFIEIECIQLHNLEPVNPSIEEWEDYEEDGLFYFPEFSYIAPNLGTEASEEQEEEQEQEQEVEVEEELTGDLMDSIHIESNQTVIIKLQENEFNSSEIPLSFNILWRVMHPSKFNPKLFESFIIDDELDGIIFISDGTHQELNAPMQIANVEEWYSTPESPYVSMKMEFTNDLELENTYEFLIGDIDASNEEHNMNMYFMGGVAGGNITTPVNPQDQLLTYLTGKYVKLTNYGTETIEFTPYFQLEHIDTVFATNPFSPTPPYSGLLGDVNIDGVINVLDVVQTVNYILGNLEFNENQQAAADWNQDDNINVLDVVSIVNHILYYGD